MDLASVKNLLGITTDKHDGYLTEIIPILTDYAKEFCNNLFLDDNNVEVLPGSVRLFIAKAAQFNMNPSGIKGRSMGGASYSYEMDFPESILRLLRPHKRVRFR